jgi:hypothetical protein
VRRRTGWALVSRRIEETLVEIFTAELAERVGPSMSVDAGARFAASSLVALLTWWLADDARPEPEVIDTTFRTLVNRGLEGAFAVAL